MFPSLIFDPTILHCRPEGMRKQADASPAQDGSSQESQYRPVVYCYVQLQSRQMLCYSVTMENITAPHCKLKSENASESQQH